MIVKTSFAKKKYCLNCLLVADDGVFALDTKVKAEELGLKVISTASTVEGISEALQNDSIDIILSEEKINDANCAYELYGGFDNLPPLVLFSELDSIGECEKSKIENSYVTIPRFFEEVALKSAVSDVLKDRINELKQSGDIKREQGTLYVRSSGKLISLRTKEINYIKAEGNYCTIHVESKRFVIRSSISNVLKKLDKPNFVQIHRGYIANVHAANVLTISNGNLQMLDQKLPIGRKYKNDIVNVLKTLNSN